MPAVPRPLHVAVGLATVSVFAACSLVFPAGDLSQGGVGGGVGGGTATGSGGASGGAGGSGDHDGGKGGGLPPIDGGPCSSNAECDDGDPCTADVCEAKGCKSTIQPGVECAPGNDCTAPSKCTPSGACAPGQQDPSKCDDKKTCTLDACGAAGCTHAPDTGAKCNDGNACDAAGTCNGSGVCAASKVMPTQVCAGSGNCPGGFYVTSFQCDGFCGGCPFCVNQITCSFACAPTVTACCGNDCSTACPAGYHVIAGPTNVAQCGCIPGPAVTCSL